MSSVNRPSAMGSPLGDNETKTTTANTYRSGKDLGWDQARGSKGFIKLNDHGYVI